MIYKQYVELIYCTNKLVLKYPKSERFNIVDDIKNATYEGLKNIITAYKLYNIEAKIKSLNNLDINLKFLKVLIRVSYKNKYISNQNYKAWSKKLTNIGNLLGAWINACLKK